jgi:Zn-finger nucleic acid-binding protein
VSAPYRDANTADHGDESGPCPRCTDVPLRAIAFGPTRLLACSACGGVFAERPVLDRVLRGDTEAFKVLAHEAMFVPARPRTTPFVLGCPLCKSSMRSVAVAAAHCQIDVCPTHGIWFDRWEAQLVADVVKDPTVAEALRTLFR